METRTRVFLTVLETTGLFLSLALLFFASLSAQVHAQQASPVRLSGQVLEHGTGEPLPGVNVFIAGTTIGASTDRDGVYAFSLSLTRNTYELVASMVGYEVATLYLQREDLQGNDLTITLRPKTYEMDQVEVTATNAAWRRNLKRFLALILSSTDNARHCTVLNPEVLDFTYKAWQDVLQATASAPLRVENRALGYELVLHDAALYGNDFQLRWQGVLQFIALTPKDEKEARLWAENRALAYRGSTRHFLASLIAGRSGREGFSIYKVDKPGMQFPKVELRPRTVLKKQADDSGPARDTRYVRFDKTLLVQYDEEPEPEAYARYLHEKGMRATLDQRTGWWLTRDYQTSWLTMLVDSVMIDKTGFEYEEYALERYGFWSWERLGDQVPFDYQPPR